MSLYERLKQAPFFVIAGPCVMEGKEMMEEVADALTTIAADLQQRGTEVPFIFKASFDKANRTSVHSYRGPGLRKGLEWLAYVKEKFALPVTTDIHEPNQADPAAEVADVLQIPAFLSRQTDLLMAAGKTGRIVNIKKGQWMSGHDMHHAVEKVRSTGNRQILLTERGNAYGYSDLIVDFRNVAWMREAGVPVIMDCTHATQRPPAGQGRTGGDRRFVLPIALAAYGFGARGFFFEVHPDPSRARSDAETQITPAQLRRVVNELARVASLDTDDR